MPSRTSGYGGYGGLQSGRGSYGQRPVYGAGRSPAARSAVSSGAAPAGGGGGPAMQLAKGDMVDHKAFGRGMVLSTQKVGGDTLLEIAFDGVGTKRLMLKFTAQHMKKL